MRTPWVHLKRLVGRTPATPTSDQEGQIRYDRDGDVDGKLYLARYLTGGTYEWMTVSPSTTYGPIYAYQSKDSGFTALSTTLTTMDSVTIGPLANGVTYDIICEVHMRLSADASSGFARAYARISTDASVIGNQTGTVGGERSCMATATKLSVVGDGATSYTLYARADMDTGTGTCASSHIRGIAIPRR